ncbi:hypothetical protein [Arthrobacter zhaoguopingii]|uniref:hypothetical protein n=1 Tax=Arthrobacter zhaoguopingii TaxID=2681491 RepID=UPI001358A425|nr:hypothetical protein [Arthrobacter zhaoguopingii]
MTPEPQRQNAWGRQEEYSSSDARTRVGAAVGTAVCTSIGSAVGTAVCTSIGSAVGTAVCTSIGSAVSAAVCTPVCASIGTAVCAAVGSPAVLNTWDTGRVTARREFLLAGILLWFSHISS